MTLSAVARRVMSQAFANRAVAQEVADAVNQAVDDWFVLGNVFFVQSTHGSALDNAANGATPSLPYATIDYAIGNCTANKGDVIVVLPSHVDTVGGAAAVNFDVAGVTVVGVGEGVDMPRFNFTNTAGTVAIGAASITIAGMHFRCAIDNLVIGLDVNKSDCKIDRCRFSESSTITNALVWIDVTGSGANECDNFKLLRSTIRNEAAGAALAVSIGAVQNNIQIENCWIEGDFSTAAIGSGSVLTNCLIKDNVISNVNAGDWCIEFTAAATGMCVGNRMYADAYATTLDPGSMKCVDNKAINGIDSSARFIPDPTTSADTVEAALWGANGITTWPAAAVPGNAVSIAEVLRDAWDALRNGTGGSEPGTNKSVVDAIGFDGVASVASTAGMLRTQAGSQFVLKIAVTSSAIPNNTQTAGAFTGAASGDILVEDIILETNATGIAGPTNIEISTDNVSGLTGAAAPSILQAVSALGANKTVVCRVTSTTKAIPLLLESGKKLFIDGDDGAGTGAGTVRITLVCRRVTDGGSLAAGGIGS